MLFTLTQLNWQLKDKYDAGLALNYLRDVSGAQM